MILSKSTPAAVVWYLVGRYGPEFEGFENLEPR